MCIRDRAAVGALAFGLAFMPVVGAPGSSRPQSKPLLVLPERQRLVLVALAMAVVVVGGTASALPYIRSWQDDTFRRDYVTTLAESVRQQAPVDLAETQVPERVVPDLMWPENRMRRLTSTFATRPSYPRVSDRLGVVAGNGAIVRAEVQKNAVRSEPGPISGCGWQLGRSTTIPLQSRTINGEFWMRIGYLSGGPSEVTVRAGSTTVRASLQSGLNDLWVLTNGGFDAVTLTDVKTGVTVCVDTIEIGAVQAGDPMP